LSISAAVNRLSIAEAGEMKHVVTLDKCRRQASTLSPIQGKGQPDFCCEFNHLQMISYVARIGLLLALFRGWKNNMFKISTIDTRRERRLVVEGTLVQPWVAELRRTWNGASQDLEGRTLVIDLRDATVMNRDGEDAICELMKEGAKFCCGDVLTRHVLKLAAHKCQTKLHKVLNRRRAKQ
jgi:hypothetical protein